MSESRAPWATILLMACGVGMIAGLLGIGGGALLVVFLATLFGFEQHRAQGTTLLTMVPPTGLLALIGYAHAGYVSWKVGLWLMPGVFLGGVFGGRWAQELSPRRLRRAFAALLVLLGIWQEISIWRR